MNEQERIAVKILIKEGKKMKHRLIIVDGQCTVGKSTLSKSLYKQIVQRDKTVWLHEECEKHPIRDGEFEAGDIHSLEGMNINQEVMLQKWQQFSDEIKESNEIVITEGCFLHSIDRYLLDSAWNEEQIMSYFKQIIEIIKPLNPLIVFLHRPDLKSSFEKGFKARGDWWRELIFRVNGTHEETVYKTLAYEQETMAKIFNTLSCDKIKVDTSEDCWDDYVRQVTEKAGYQYNKKVTEIPEVEKYCGKYIMEDGEDTWTISYDNETKEIYSTLFWPYMQMKYIGNEQFELISFPITIQFDVIQEKIQFTVQGNYDWGYNSKKFIKT